MEFTMPASADIVFDAFHFHHWRHRWDSLVSATQVLGGAPCPYVGAVTENSGGGWMRALSMQTRFVSFDRPYLAAASMVGTSFPFSRWAASMRHKDQDARNSVLIYTYTFEVGPRWTTWLLGPVVNTVFEHQTRKRFARLQTFLVRHSQEIADWQKENKAHDAL
ncbi:SRPBCC family protein [Rhodoferax saidenbachensis]|nr:SRPBCC family protein [Rhodoferax saidenbachensis]